MLSQSSHRSLRIPLAGGVATLLAALAIAAPAGAAEPTSAATGVSSGAGDVALNFTLSPRAAVIDYFRGSVAQDFH